MDTQRAVAKDRLVEQLEEARQRTGWLLRAVSEGDLYGQHDPTMSPLITCSKARVRFPGPVRRLTRYKADRT